jgi:hypothetical protein
VEKNLKPGGAAIEKTGNHGIGLKGQVIWRPYTDDHGTQANF